MNTILKLLFIFIFKSKLNIIFLFLKKNTEYYLQI